nr:MAG TPA_asm: hypothetical protein [Caudoviricetes sp.]
MASYGSESYYSQSYYSQKSIYKRNLYIDMCTAMFISGSVGWHGARFGN